MDISRSRLRHTRCLRISTRLYGSNQERPRAMGYDNCHVAAAARPLEYRDDLPQRSQILGRRTESHSRQTWNNMGLVLEAAGGGEERVKHPSQRWTGERVPWARQHRAVPREQSKHSCSIDAAGDGVHAPLLSAVRGLDSIAASRTSTLRDSTRRGRCISPRFFSDPSRPTHPPSIPASSPWPTLSTSQAVGRLAWPRSAHVTREMPTTSPTGFPCTRRHCFPRRPPRAAARAKPTRNAVQGVIDRPVVVVETALGPRAPIEPQRAR